MSFIDISRPLYSELAVWPGDTPFQIETTASIDRGDSINLTTLRLSAHTGTHVDAPLHFMKQGSSIEEMGISVYWGLAQVVSLHLQKGPLYPKDVEAIDFSIAPRILFRSSCSKLSLTQFPPEFIYPSPALVSYMAAQGVILFGTDAPSVDATDSKDLPGHHALKEHGIAILEGLMLEHVDPGIYELVALPLPIRGGDGSPVRAVLKTLSNS